MSACSIDPALVTKRRWGCVKLTQRGSHRRRLSVGVCVWVAAMSANAEPVTVGVHVATYHFKRDAGYTEFNPGLYARSGQWQAGAYRNSQNRLTAYAVRNFEIAGFALSLGLATGYGKTVSLIGGLSWRFDSGPALTLFPKAPKGRSGGIHLSSDLGEL